MAEDKTAKDTKGDNQLGPRSSFFISFLIWSVVIVPLSMGLFFMLEIFPRFTDLGNQYSVVLGLFIGLVISAVAGYFYSLRARKQIE